MSNIKKEMSGFLQSAKKALIISGNRNSILPEKAMIFLMRLHLIEFQKLQKR